ncbi:MAG: chorismate synthase [Candidatus Sumerlaeia bacterium]|nr:chorismate synthase [Candidatus Sumerlaeia bacterium]
MALQYVTAGETHGPQLTAIITGLPAGLALTADDINRDLVRRQAGYGRGKRMAIEHDRVRFQSGLRFGRTLGSPLTMVIENHDWPNWQAIMALEGRGETDAARARAITRPRPGHADLPGVLKWHQHDARNVLERASARETAARVAVGAVARRFLAGFGIRVFSHVVHLGGISIDCAGLTYAVIAEAADASPFRIGNRDCEDMLKARVDRAAEEGDTLGGIFEVVATGLPAGLGSCMESTGRLDGRLAGAVMSIQGIKGVEIGLGFEGARLPGSRVHDPIFFDREREDRYLEGHGFTGGYFRTSNNAGGLEGGMTNGEPVVIRAAMKPIATLGRPLPSVDFETKEPFHAAHERSDVCAVPAAAVVGEAVVVFVLAQAFLEKFGGDHMEEVSAAFEHYLQYLNTR